MLWFLALLNGPSYIKPYHRFTYQLLTDSSGGGLQQIVVRTFRFFYSGLAIHQIQTPVEAGVLHGHDS